MKKIPKIRSLFISAVILAAIVIVYSLPCALALDEEVRDRYPAVELPPEDLERWDEEEYQDWTEEGLEYRGYIDIQQGYDNNVDLDPDRHKDGFLQSMVNVDLTYKGVNKLKIKAGTDVFSTIYYKYNYDNLLDVTPYVGVDIDILPNLVLTNRAKYDYFSYPNTKERTFSGLVLSSTLRHYVKKDLYHEAGVEYLKRWYPDRKIYLNNGRITSRERIDDRFKVKYNVGYYGERYFLRLSNEFYKNDSSDEYQEYYDYWLYRVRPSVMVFITEKFYTDLSFIYKHFHYEDRRSTDNANQRTRNNNYIFNAAFFYDLTKKVTLSFTYSYNEMDSNDPFERYSGSIVSGGVYYSF